MEDAVRVVLLMTVLMASGCVVREGPPRHNHWFWHGRHAEPGRRAEVANPVSGEALSLPPKASEQ